MRIKSLSVSRETWKTGEPLIGSIRFENQFGEVEVKLDEDKCKALINIVADAMVAQAQATANLLRDNIIEAVAGQPLIEQAA